jgi:hypothetical protein
VYEIFTRNIPHSSLITCLVFLIAINPEIPSQKGLYYIRFPSLRKPNLPIRTKLGRPSTDLWDQAFPGDVMGPPMPLALSFLAYIYKTTYQM